jgi:hypothetical protein
MKLADSSLISRLTTSCQEVLMTRDLTTHVTGSLRAANASLIRLMTVFLDLVAKMKSHQIQEMG